MLDSSKFQKNFEFQPMQEEDSGEDEDIFPEDSEEEVTIDLEDVLRHHRSVRIRVPPRAKAREGSGEDGARELVVSMGDEDKSGVVF